MFMIEVFNIWNKGGREGNNNQKSNHMKYGRQKEILVMGKEQENMNGKRIITRNMLECWRQQLAEDEKSEATIQKYIRDLEKLAEYLAGSEVTKEKMIQYKDYLLHEKSYKISSINSFLVAANHFLEQIGWLDARVKTYKVQKEAFCPNEKYLSQREYERLVRTAVQQGKERIALILQTIGGTGIRISELSYITVESLACGMADVHNKGKTRRILYPKALQKLLSDYVKRKKITSGCVFCTSSGRPIDRSNIWKQMKALCEEAGVEKSKVFPHNLRHLFARCFYQIKKDIAKLADILGHSSIETTRIYIKSTGMEHRKQLDAMGMVRRC